MNLDFSKNYFFIVIIALFLQPAHAEVVTYYEVYLKIASAHSDIVRNCSSLEEYAQTQSILECSQSNSVKQIYRLRVNFNKFNEFNKWLTSKKSEKILDWYEYQNTPLSLQSMNKSPITAAQQNLYQSIIPINKSSDDPDFITQPILKARGFLNFHPPIEPITVAVIDSGVNFNNEYLPNEVKWKNLKELPANEIDDDGNGYVDDISGWDFVDNLSGNINDDFGTPDNDPSDKLGHGTAVSSIITSTIGLTYSNIVKIIPLRVASGVSGSGDITPFALAEAINYAVDNGAKIINISAASSVDYQVVTEAVIRAKQNNITVIAAAGNNAGKVLFPAKLEGVISVGALDENNKIWEGSAFGDGVDLFIRGTNMFKASDVFPKITDSGTSFSTPEITGLSAMMQAILFEPNKSNTYCQATLDKIQTAVPSSSIVDDWLADMMYLIEKHNNYNDMSSMWEANTPLCNSQINVSSLVRSL